MSWSRTGNLFSGTDQKVRIKTKQGELGLSNLEMQHAANVVSASRMILPMVIAWVSWPAGEIKTRRNAYMARYFKCAPGGPDQNDVNTVLKKLELVMNGINTKINLKVAADDDAYGYVGFRGGIKGVMRGVFSKRHNIGTRGGKMVSRGDIHLDRDVLDDEGLAIITFIHEATHKYASTADHGDSGYLANDGVAFEAPGLTRTQALNNADSYAWFCYNMFYEAS